MHRRDFSFHLPPELIAQEPLPERASSRLLVLAPGRSDPQDSRFAVLPEWLRKDDLLVFNDTRVIAARLFGVRKPGGGQVEMLLEQLISERRARLQISSNRPVRAGQVIVLAPDVQAEVAEAHPGGFYDLVLTGRPSWEVVSAEFGHVPLPPYIRRPDRAADRERYQTVFARHPGAVAAPTAALHFDEPLLARLQAQGIEFAFITLHVGAGTFLPMRTEQVAEHRLHAEHAVVTEAACASIKEALRSGRRVVAVGTTVARTLEAASGAPGEIEPLSGPIANFIYPGHSFNIVRSLITNFHLPESTLLMLVCALGGTERVLAAYRHAVEARYRFFSYGDAMLLSEQDARTWGA